MADTACTDDVETVQHPLADTIGDILEGMSNVVFADACGDSFRTITGWNVGDVDALWINVDRWSMTGSADAWTIEIRLGVDSDCGKDDYDLVVSGACSLGITRFHSVTLA